MMPLITINNNNEKNYISTYFKSLFLLDLLLSRMLGILLGATCAYSPGAGGDYQVML